MQRPPTAWTFSFGPRPAIHAPRPSDMTTGANSIIPYGLSVWCVQERGYQLTEPYPTFGRDMW